MSGYIHRGGWGTYFNTNVNGLKQLLFLTLITKIVDRRDIDFEHI